MQRAPTPLETRIAQFAIANATVAAGLKPGPASPDRIAWWSAQHLLQYGFKTVPAEDTYTHLIEVIEKDVHRAPTEAERKLAKLVTELAIDAASEVYGTSFEVVSDWAGERLAESGFIMNRRPTDGSLILSAVEE